MGINSMAKKLNYTYAAGKRKVASARVRLFKGKGENTVNEIAAGKYFPGEINRLMMEKPFSLTETSGKYHFSARIIGGGKEGQLDALVHGLSRALSLVDKEKNRSVLKKAGLLTRDSRKRERRMVGTGGKARRAKQSPKR